MINFPPDPLKNCTKCNKFKPLSEFYRQVKGQNKLRSRCKTCTDTQLAVWRKSNPAKNRSYSREYKRNNPKHQSQVDLKSRLKNNYGITVEDFNLLLKSQEGRCAICRTPNPGPKLNVFCVDHDHNTGKVRGLLCRTCNHGLGSFRDNPEFLREAAHYLETSAMIQQSETNRPAGQEETQK